MIVSSSGCYLPKTVHDHGCLVAAITAMPHRGGPDHGDATSSWLSLARGQGMGFAGLAGFTSQASSRARSQAPGALAGDRRLHPVCA